MRQATLNPSAEELYLKNLSGYDMRDVAEAVKAMALEPRGAFESAFPDLGTILGRVQAIRDSRQRRPKFVACGMNGCKGGFLIVADARYSYAAECDCLKRWRGGEQAAVPDPIAEHLRELHAHPERFVPVDACIQVGRALTAAKLERVRAGNPITDEQYRALRKRLTREMNEKWLGQLHGDTEDRKTTAAGA